MKRYGFILITLMLGGLYAGCGENDIVLYDETPRLYFSTTIAEYVFRDSDYVKEHEFHELKMNVHLQGIFLNEARDFCLKASNDTANVEALVVILEEKYTFSMLKSNIQSIGVKVKRPSRVTTKACLAYLTFDQENPLFQFDAGRVDKNTSKVMIGYKIKPDGWYSYYWGAYSDGKYFFMMDHFKRVYNDIEESMESCKEVAAAYDAYRKNNPAILDDKGVEIVFPYK